MRERIEQWEYTELKYLRPGRLDVRVVLTESTIIENV